MAKGGTIHVLDRGRVLAEFGPMSLIIFAAVGNVPQVHESVRAGQLSFLFLERIASYQEHLKNAIRSCTSGTGESLVDAMIDAVSKVNDHELTPIAAVAGTIADAVADFLFQRGMTKVIVSNGGDIAIRLGKGESVTVGIKDRIEATKDILGTIVLDYSSPTWGVATSGVGGRSLTRGIASGATVIAKRAGIADAAATSVANHTFVQDQVVAQVMADELDPETDIPGLLVTSSVGPLPEEKKDMGLLRGLSKARELINMGVIEGAFAAIQGKYMMTEFFEERWNFAGR